MSTVYWVSFEIADQTTDAGTYNERYNDLVAAMKQHGKHWDRTTSFVVFESTSDLKTLAASLKAVIDPRVDLLLIRTMDNKTAYICGKNTDDDIHDLMPYLKKL